MITTWQYMMAIPSSSWAKAGDFLSFDASMYIPGVAGGQIVSPQGTYPTTTPTHLIKAPANKQSKWGTAFCMNSGATYGQHVTVPGNVNLLTGTNNYCIDYWELEDGTAASFCPIMKMPWTSNDRFEIAGWDTNPANWAVWNNSSIPKATPYGAQISVGTWRHVAIQQIGTAMAVYVNGIQVGTASYTRLEASGAIWAITKLYAAFSYFDRYRARKGTYFTGASFDLNAIYP